MLALLAGLASAWAGTGPAAANRTDFGWMQESCTKAEIGIENIRKKKENIEENRKDRENCFVLI